MTFIVILAVAGLLIWLARGLMRASRARRVARAGYFAGVAGAFDNARTQIAPSGFARVAGVWNGARFDLQAVPDTLTFRKLPVLWVMVTLTEPVPVAGEVHIMARPAQTDVFSNFGKMAVTVALPAGFPDDCSLVCDSPDALPPQELIAGLAGLFGDGRMKELVISPKGLRVVLLADEAERGAYLLFRDAELGQTAFAVDRLLPHLATLGALWDDLKRLKETAHG